MNILKLILVFTLLTIILTFPLVLNIDSFIPAFHSTDEPYGALWYFWWMKYSHLEHLNISNITMIAVPFGRILGPGCFYWNLINQGLLFVGSPVFSYNIQILFSFLITGIITYLLVFYILKHRIAALFAAIIFAFCPYHFMRSWQHLGLAHIQWIPLYILSVLFLHKRKTIKSAILSASSFSLVMSFDLYYAYFMFIVTIMFIVYDYTYHQKNIKETFNLLKLFLICVFFILLFESYDLYYVVKHISNLTKLNNTQGVYGYIRPFEDLFSQSARPLSYLLPSVAQPVFGKFTEQFIGSQLYGISFTEHTLYLGWSPLILAFVAFRRWRRKHRETKEHPSLGTVPEGNRPYQKENFYLGFFIFLAIIAWFFSQPPWWKLGAIKIFMPSFFMYKVASMFRAYCRFGIVVMLAVAVLAGFGLKFILEKFKSYKTKVALTCLFSGLVLFEFWNYPPFKIIDVSKVPSIYYWLKEQPKDIVIAEYPLDINGANEMYKFYQTKHEKKIINGTIPGTYANKLAQTIAKLSDINTAGILKWMGVKYVLVHKEDYLKTELIEDKEELDKIPHNSGLKFIRGFPSQECPQKDIICVQRTGPIDVYEVITQPIKPKVKEK